MQLSGKMQDMLTNVTSLGILLTRQQRLKENPLLIPGLSMQECTWNEIWPCVQGPTQEGHRGCNGASATAVSGLARRCAERTMSQ